MIHILLHSSMSPSSLHRASANLVRIGGSRFFHVMVIAAFVLCAIGTASAQALIFQDYFESYTAGSPPPVPWETSGTFIGVSTGSQSAFGPGGDVQGARILDNSGSSIPSLERSFTLSPGEQSQSLVIGFDYMYTSATGNPQFAVLDGSTSGIRMMLTNPSGFVSIREGSSFNQTSISLDTNTWYRFTLTIYALDSVSDSYDLSVETYGGSTTTVTGLSFENQVSDLTSLRFNYNTAASVSGGDYSIDNVYVQSIPEPSSVSFGLLALVATAFFWRRKRMASSER